MVNFSPPPPRQSGPGYFGGGQWNPTEYYNILPYLEGLGAGQVVLPGWGGPGGFTTNNYGGDSFSFPFNPQQTVNTYQGGPNVFNGGDFITQNSYSNTVNTNNVNTTNINVTNINGRPVAGPAGPQGRAGAAGEASGFPVPVPIPFPVPQPPFGGGGGGGGGYQLNSGTKNVTGTGSTTIPVTTYACVDGEFVPSTTNETISISVTVAVPTYTLAAKDTYP
jgi:hypothetical protein